MYQLTITLGLVLVSTIAISQNKVDSLYNFIVNEYFINRIHTKKIYIQKESVEGLIVTDLMKNEITELKELYNQPIWSELMKDINDSSIKKHRTKIKHSNFKYLSQREVNKMLDRIKLEGKLHIKDPITNWKYFKEKYPDCDGILSLSYPAISKDNQKFIIFIEYYNATNEGFGDLITGMKIDNKWKILKEINILKPIIETIVIGD